MNDLTQRTAQLPDTIEEVADFVVVNEEKLNAVKAAIRLARKANDINLAELETQQRELEKTTVLAQCKLGELTAKMEKNAGRPSNNFSEPRKNFKQEQLRNIGVSYQRANEYEKMAAHPEIVQQVIESGKPVTKAAILQNIKRKERQEAIKEQEAQPRSSSYVDIFTTDKKYRVIYADPPWSYNDKMDTAKLGGAVKYYDTMPLNDICEMRIPAEKNAVLFLWTTSPQLEDSFRVINAWGFKYKSSFIWDKISHAMGHYNSVRHEFLLIATRGNCTPDVKKLYDSVISIERTEHSRKPKEFREIIDTLYPIGNRIELFAREAAEGWDVWGNMA